MQLRPSDGIRCSMCKFLAVFVVVFAAGCGSKSPEGGSTSASRPKPGIPTITREEIGALGEPLPPLDGGRLELTAPKDWIAAPRDKKFVAQFVEKAGQSYPRILVTTQDSADPTDLTGKNVKSFARKVEAELNDRSEDDAEPTTDDSPVTPVKIGERYWVESTRAAHAKNVKLERLVLVTVVNGRRYTVELRTVVGSLRAHRSRALAVASALKPLSDAAPAAESEE